MLWLRTVLTLLLLGWAATPARANLAPPDWLDDSLDRNQQCVRFAGLELFPEYQFFLLPNFEGRTLPLRLAASDREADFSNRGDFLYCEDGEYIDDSRSHHFATELTLCAVPQTDAHLIDELWGGRTSDRYPEILALYRDHPQVRLTAGRILLGRAMDPSAREHVHTLIRVGETLELTLDSSAPALLDFAAAEPEHTLANPSLLVEGIAEHPDFLIYAVKWGGQGLDVEELVPGRHISALMSWREFGRTLTFIAVPRAEQAAFLELANQPLFGMLILPTLESDPRFRPSGLRIPLPRLKEGTSEELWIYGIDAITDTELRISARNDAALLEPVPTPVAQSRGTGTAPLTLSLLAGVALLYWGLARRQWA